MSRVDEAIRRVEGARGAVVAASRALDRRRSSNGGPPSVLISGPSWEALQAALVRLAAAETDHAQAMAADEATHPEHVPTMQGRATITAVAVDEHQPPEDCSAPKGDA